MDGFRVDAIWLFYGYGQKILATPLGIALQEVPFTFLGPKHLLPSC